jgi:tetratricopeptide (TPR) repeat protein
MFKSVDEAQRVAVELRELIEKGIYKKSIRIYHLLMGVIEFEKRNISKAIEYLEKAVMSLPYQDSFSRFHAIFIYSLALAYYEAKDLDKALEEYNLTRFYIMIILLTSSKLGDL